MVSLCDLLRLDQIELNLRAGDQLSVLQELVGLVPELRQEPLQREVFVKALIERERLHSTAVGDGIALPHARNPVGTVLKRSLVVFGRHPSGIDYHAPDRTAVRLFFLIASANLTEHLAVLARISRMLRDQKLRADLLAVAQREAVVQAMREAEQRYGR